MEQLTEDVLGSKVPKDALYRMRDMIVSAAWDDFCDVMDNCVKVNCAEILGKDAPSADELQALAGVWKTLEQATARFPQELATAIESLMEREAEIAREASK